MSVSTRGQNARPTTASPKAAKVARAAQAAGAKTIAQGLATVAIAVVILNEILTIEAIQNSTGPMSGVIDSVETIGGSALTLTVLAFLVLAGAVAMRYMDRF